MALAILLNQFNKHQNPNFFVYHFCQHLFFMYKSFNTFIDAFFPPVKNIFEFASYTHHFSTQPPWPTHFRSFCQLSYYTSEAFKPKIQTWLLACVFNIQVWVINMAVTRGWKRKSLLHLLSIPSFRYQSLLDSDLDLISASENWKKGGKNPERGDAYEVRPSSLCCYIYRPPSHLSPQTD